MPSINDIRAAQQRTATSRGPSPAEAAAHDQARRLVVVRMERILAADDWTTLKLHIEDGFRSPAQAALDIEREKLERGELVGDEAAKTSLRIRLLRERLDTIDQILALPQFVVDAGKAADSA